MAHSMWKTNKQKIPNWKPSEIRKQKRLLGSTLDTIQNHWNYAIRFEGFLAWTLFGFQLLIGGQ